MQIVDKTLWWVTKTDFDWRVFVEQRELLYYKQIFQRKGLSVSNLVVIPKNDMGLGYSMHMIKKYCQQNGYELAMKLDDDVKAIMDERVKKEHTPKVITKILNEVIGEFEHQSKLGGVRLISARIYYYYKKHSSRYLYRNELLWNSYVYRVSAYSVPKHFPSHIDTLTSLFMFKEGYYTLTYNGGIVADIYTNRGGLQALDRKALCLKVVEYLKEAGFKRVKFIKSKNGLGYDIDYTAYKPKKEKLY